MPQPNKIPLAFAASGDKNIIPESTETTGLASWRDGFPAITSAPFSEGGIAPKRADFNGIFNALSLATLWQQQGGFYAYDATTDYEVGNVVEYSGDLYKCLSANGPSSAVKAPTDATVWSKVMTAADAAALYFPLSGGAMSGNITKNTRDNYFYISGGLGWDLAQNGARIALYGKDHTSLPGVFKLSAGSSVGTPELLGKPDGSLTWGGIDVATIQTGTWTPVLKGSATNGAFTYSAQVGIYHKIGKLVYVYGQLVPTACTELPSGVVQISGLPYVAKGFSDGRVMSIWGRANGFDSNSAQKIIGFYVGGNSSVLTARTNTDDSTIGISSYYEAAWSNTEATFARVKVSVASYDRTGINFAGLYLAQ